MIRSTIIVAQSIDGCITRHGEPGTAFCSQADHRFFREALSAFDSMIMGRATFEISQTEILASKSQQWLRKVLTRSPDQWSQHSKIGTLEFTDQALGNVLNELSRRGLQNCAILGGESVYEQALESSLASDLWVTIEARAFGSGKRLAQRPIDAAFELETVEALGAQTALLKFRR